MNPNITSARLENDAYNIQHGRLTSHNSAKNPCSTSPSPMDNSFPPLEVDYAEHIATNCNTDIEITDPFLPLVENATCFSFSLPASNPHVPLEEAPNSINISDIDISAELSPPKVIPYSANVPADPSLWNRNFMATSLFGTNEFLNSDINNIMCSLRCIACFLRQRNVKDQNANNIRQLDPFNELVWDFISAIFESGWDTFTTANKSSIRDNLAKEFGKTTKPLPNVNICHGVHISKVSPLSHPALLRKFWRSQRPINVKSLPKENPLCLMLKLHQMLQMPSR